MNISENYFITGDGKQIFLVTETGLKIAEHFGWREATNKEVKDYYGAIQKRDEDNIKAFFSEESEIKLKE